MIEKVLKNTSLRRIVSIVIVMIMVTPFIPVKVMQVSGGSESGNAVYDSQDVKNAGNRYASDDESGDKKDNLGSDDEQRNIDDKSVHEQENALPFLEKEETFITTNDDSTEPSEDKQDGTEDKQDGTEDKQDGTEDEPVHVHEYENEWSHDAYTHWKECISAVGTCDEPRKDEEEHVYDQEVVADEYMNTGATCTKKAVYYKSCKCGAIGNETFEGGYALEHVWQFSASESTLVATCDNDSSHKMTLTLIVSSKNYAGEPADITVGTATEREIWQAAGLEIPSNIVHCEGEYIFKEAPTDVGNYTAKLVMDGMDENDENVAYVNYTILDKDDSGYSEGSDDEDYGNNDEDIASSDSGSKNDGTTASEDEKNDENKDENKDDDNDGGDVISKEDGSSVNGSATSSNSSYNSSGSSLSGNKSNKTSKSKVQSKGTKTGDSNNLLMWGIISMSSLVVIITMILAGKEFGLYKRIRR